MATTTKRKTKAQLTEEHALSYFDAVTARDLDAMVAHMADDVIEDITPVGILRGTGEVRQFFGELFAAFPDFEFSVERATSTASTSAVQWRATGTFRGAPFQGIEPTGRRVEMRGCDCIDVEDGKITRNTAYYDGAAFARGLGMLPQTGSGGEKAMLAAFNAVTKVRSRFASPPR
ncbi:MAG TPA: ester cyclase [Thermoleophilaceae bacterium]